MISINRYNSDLQEEWDNFIDISINGTFILKRTFMDYHKDIYIDHSYLIYKDQKLLGVFTAAHHYENRNVITAHGGLTYGGLITNERLRYNVLEEIFNQLRITFQQEGYRKLVVKPVPRSFASVYNEIDQFYFYKHNFKITAQEINSYIYLNQPLQFNNNRKANLKKAKKYNLQISMKDDLTSYEIFWEILTHNLINTHNVNPIHTLEDIKYLKSKNDNHIKLYVSEFQGEIIAGIVLFVDVKKGFVHTQYISSDENGKKMGAIDAIIFQIIEDYKDKAEKLSFGVSSVNGNINYGLLGQKEGFGTIADIFRIYEIELEDKLN